MFYCPPLAELDCLSSQSRTAATLRSGRVRIPFLALRPGGPGRVLGPGPNCTCLVGLGGLAGRRGGPVRDWERVVGRAPGRLPAASSEFLRSEPVRWSPARPAWLYCCLTSARLDRIE